MAEMNPKASPWQIPVKQFSSNPALPRAPGLQPGEDLPLTSWPELPSASAKGASLSQAYPKNPQTPRNIKAIPTFELSSSIPSIPEVSPAKEKSEPVEHHTPQVSHPKESDSVEIQDHLEIRDISPSRIHRSDSDLQHPKPLRSISLEINAKGTTPAPQENTAHYQVRQTPSAQFVPPTRPVYIIPQVRPAQKFIYPRNPQTHQENRTYCPAMAPPHALPQQMTYRQALASQPLPKYPVQQPNRQPVQRRITFSSPMSRDAMHQEFPHTATEEAKANQYYVDQPGTPLVPVLPPSHRQQNSHPPPPPPPTPGTPSSHHRQNSQPPSRILPGTPSSHPRRGSQAVHHVYDEASLITAVREDPKALLEAIRNLKTCKFELSSQNKEMAQRLQEHEEKWVEIEKERELRKWLVEKYEVHSMSLQLSHLSLLWEAVLISIGAPRTKRPKTISPLQPN